MKDRSSLLNLVFVCFIVCMAVVISVRGKWAALETIADRQNDTYVVKHTGYYNRRAITGPDGQTDIPDDRLERNNFSTTMIDDMKGVSATSTMSMP